MGKSDKLFETYFKAGTRGHGYICNFFARYRDVFRHTEYTQPDALIDQIYLNLASIRSSAITGDEGHYVIKAIYYQCWKIFYAEKEKQSRFVAESRLKLPGDDSAPGESWTDDRPLPDALAEGQDLFEVIQQFRQDLTSNESRILNALIDGWSATQMSKSLKIKLNTVNVTVFRLRKKLDEFLQDAGHLQPPKKT